MVSEGFFLLLAFGASLCCFCVEAFLTKLESNHLNRKGESNLSK